MEGAKSCRQTYQSFICLLIGRRQLTSRATILWQTSSLMLISTSNSDRRLSASVLAARTSLQGDTCCGKSNMFLWTEAQEGGVSKRRAGSVRTGRGQTGETPQQRHSQFEGFLHPTGSNMVDLFLQANLKISIAVVSSLTADGIMNYYRKKILWQTELYDT